MKKFKYLLEFADYTNNDRSIITKSIDVSQVDRKDINDLKKDIQFQNIQGKMQSQIQKDIQKKNPDKEINTSDAEQISDYHLAGNSIGNKKKVKIKEIVDDPKLSDNQKAKKIIDRGKKEIAVNYGKKEDNPTERGEMSTD